MNKIIRSICYFSEKPDELIAQKLSSIEQILINAGYKVQSKRLCAPISIKEAAALDLPNIPISVGTLTKAEIESQFKEFIDSTNVFCNIDLCDIKNIDDSITDLLFDIIKHKAAKTFNFSYVFNNCHSSPFFPSATYHQDGFSIGLQATDLSESCETLNEWLQKMRECWTEITQLFGCDQDFLGIDSSVSPLFSGKGSFINFVNKLFIMGFPFTTTTDFYVKITKFLKTQNPKPVGLCGIMFPCVEDFSLAEAYEENEFSIERNIFLSLHSGLGVDVYPIGIDEEKEQVKEILALLKGLAEKYNKALGARFVSDGKAKRGQSAKFMNPYLKDVVINPL